MGAGLIWGVFILLVGVALIIKVIFNVDFPVVKIFLGLFLVFLGLKVLLTKNDFMRGHTGSNETIFSERVYNIPEKGKGL